MKQLKTSIALGGMCCLVCLGCKPDELNDLTGTCWECQVSYLNGKAPSSGTAQAWQSLEWEGGWTGVPHVIDLGTSPLTGGRVSWPLSPEVDAITVHALDRHGRESQRQYELAGCGEYRIELPTPSTLGLQLNGVPSEGGRLHAFWAENSTPPSLASWIARGTNGTWMDCTEGAPADPAFLDYSFPIGPSELPMYVQWYWAAVNGAITPLETTEIWIPRSSAGDTAWTSFSL